MFHKKEKQDPHWYQKKSLLEKIKFARNGDSSISKNSLNQSPSRVSRDKGSDNLCLVLKPVFLMDKYLKVYNLSS